MKCETAVADCKEVTERLTMDAVSIRSQGKSFGFPAVYG
ncbi:hypothetical protein TRIP_B350536 [uncultured Desulfatiglans sp.]|uniref:Uncharacterized protein n=1 Tax=Uncultured Desulfatiglans sp. TaxID=1748965 RepID=A0A653AC60_UNCDX|nr:hypothetical protein TRIP_B350536 [uncultured Desulfatiglans sp.]